MNDFRALRIACMLARKKSDSGDDICAVVWTVATEQNEHCGHVHRMREEAERCRASLGAEFHLYFGDPRNQDDPCWMGPKPRIRGYVD
jgi:hypothetical protein